MQHIPELTETSHFKDVGAKSSTTQIFFILLLHSDNELLMSEMPKNWGLTDLFSK